MLVEFGFVAVIKQWKLRNLNAKPGRQFSGKEPCVNVSHILDSTNTSEISSCK